MADHLAVLGSAPQWGYPQPPSSPPAGGQPYGPYPGQGAASVRRKTPWIVGVAVGVVIVASVMLAVLLWGGQRPDSTDELPAPVGTSTPSVSPSDSTPTPSVLPPSATASPSTQRPEPSASETGSWRKEMPAKVGGWQTTDTDMLPVRYTRGNDRLIAMAWPYLEVSDLARGLEDTKSMGDSVCGYTSEQAIPTCLIPLPDGGVLQVSAANHDTILQFGEAFLKVWDD